MNNQIEVFEGVADLNEEQMKLISDIFSSYFPVYLDYTTDYSHSQFCHSLMGRHEELNTEGHIVSTAYEPFRDLFMDIANKSNIKVNKILRAAINTTWHYNEKYGKVHIDHENQPHNNFVMYLNEFDEGHTYLFDDNGNISYEVIPEKNKYVFFEGTPHAQGFCAPGQLRTVLVFTFN